MSRHYRFISTPMPHEYASIANHIETLKKTYPDNPIRILEETLQKCLKPFLKDLKESLALYQKKEAHTDKESTISTIYDRAFRVYFARHMSQMYADIFGDTTYSNAPNRIKKQENGIWHPLDKQDWAPAVRDCLGEERRYSRVVLSALMSAIPIQIIAFVFLPLPETSGPFMTRTPIHDHSAPCTGATIFQDSRAFTLEDRYTALEPSSIHTRYKRDAERDYVDFSGKRGWCEPLQPVTDLKNEMHPNVIHSVSYHSFVSDVTPSLRVHIYGSATPNNKLDYAFLPRAFSTDDIPQNTRASLFKYGHFLNSSQAHEI